MDRRFELLEALFKGATLPLALLPMPLACALGEHLALLVGRLWRGRMNFAVDNVKKAMAHGAVPTGRDPNKVVESHFKNLGRSFVELIKIYHGRGEAILAGVRVEGGEHYQKARTKQKGVIVITGHCGNWELMSLAFAVNFGKKPCGGQSLETAGS